MSIMAWLLVVTGALLGLGTALSASRHRWGAVALQAGLVLVGMALLLVFRLMWVVPFALPFTAFTLGTKLVLWLSPRTHSRARPEDR